MTWAVEARDKGGWGIPWTITPGGRTIAIPWYSNHVAYYVTERLCSNPMQCTFSDRLLEINWGSRGGGVTSTGGGAMPVLVCLGFLRQKLQWVWCKRGANTWQSFATRDCRLVTFASLQACRRDLFFKKKKASERWKQLVLSLHSPTSWPSTPAKNTAVAPEICCLD